MMFDVSDWLLYVVSSFNDTTYERQYPPKYMWIHAHMYQQGTILVLETDLVCVCKIVDLKLNWDGTSAHRQQAHDDSTRLLDGGTG